jgi:hypothetical protein
MDEKRGARRAVETAGRRQILAEARHSIRVAGQDQFPISSAGRRITPTLKIKRNVVSYGYQDGLEALYQ